MSCLPKAPGLDDIDTVTLLPVRSVPADCETFRCPPPPDTVIDQVTGPPCAVSLIVAAPLLIDSWPPGGSTTSVPAIGEGEAVGLGVTVGDAVLVGVAVGDAAFVRVAAGPGEVAGRVAGPVLSGVAATAAEARAPEGPGPPPAVPCPVFPASAMATPAMAAASTSPARVARPRAEDRPSPLPPADGSPAAGGRSGLGNPCCPNEPARPSTVARCATALGLRPRASAIVCALSPAGAPAESRKFSSAPAMTAAPGDSPSSIAGRNS